MKRMLEVVGWLAAVSIFALAGASVLAAEGAQQHSRGRTVDERQEARAEERSPVSILRAARKVYVRPGRHVDAKYLEYKLQKHAEFAAWGLVFVEEERAADLVVKVDKTMLNYIFSVVDPETSIVVLTGKVVAVNKQLAAEYLGTEIIKKMRKARAAPDNPAPPRKKKDAADDEEEWSES